MRSCLESIPDDCRRVFVAYSGGLDSSVLLHLLLSTGRAYEILPWHINHGLVENSSQMEQFCIQQAQAYGLEIRVDRLDLADVDSNIEAVARRQRYRLFAENTHAGDCILTAHHADDQAETFLMNALRGSGVSGLRGIARRRRLGSSLLLRPLLEFSRGRLEDYARRHEIAWFNDPSNQNPRFDRNYLRYHIVPLIKQRWPGYQNALTTSSEIQSETQDLLDEVGSRDYQELHLPDPGKIDRLDINGMLQLSLPRRKNLVRYWIASAGLPAPPFTRLQELMHQLQARPDAMPEVAMPGYSLRIYDRQLFLVFEPARDECGGAIEFGQLEEIEIPQLNLRLSRKEILQRLGVEDKNQSLTLKFRRRGEQNEDSHRLKRLFQRHRVPPWERDSTAQLYLDGRLEGLLR
ncbi:MAG: tRNA lysidine(34) synthetase TilS [Gammaproteobacteria bacterium]|jgi:tRNA(Ile)-lysidine synthase|nr:tRNA lysidine(34) synthetase TilS [Gammaproteobacteria bacterium]